MKAEKRKFDRFVPIEGTFAALENGLLKVGKIKDISLGGLAFEYVYDKKSGPNGNRVDIFMSGKRYFLQDVPCQEVYDKMLPPDYEYLPFSSTIMNRCGLQFGKLSTDQSEKLSSFIGARIISSMS